MFCVEGFAVGWLGGIWWPSVFGFRGLGGDLWVGGLRFTCVEFDVFGVFLGFRFLRGVGVI